MMKRLAVAAIVAMTLAQPAAAADKPSDAAALKGVKTGKVVWDISMANAETLAVFLSVVRETYDDLKRQNVEPDMVLAIHGVPVKYVTRTSDALPFELQVPVEKVTAVLDDMAKRPGVRIEVCSVANRLMGVDNAAIRDGYTVVGNTWVSLIGYQAQGYAVVPIN